MSICVNKYTHIYYDSLLLYTAVNELYIPLVMAVTHLNNNVCDTY